MKTCRIQSRTRHRSGKVQIAARLEKKFYDNFLPLVLSKQYARRIVRAYPGEIRLWEGSNGKGVLSLPPLPNMADDPTAKPDRLGRVIGRLAWYYRQNLNDKIETANEVLYRLLDATNEVAVSFSGGRDSLVALHLALQIEPDVPVVFVNTSIEFPETVAYVRQLAKDWSLNLHEVKPNVNFWKLAEEQGIPVGGRGNTTFLRDLSEKANVKLSNSCCRRMKETPARQFYAQHGLEGMITGLRVSESLMRKLNFADYGALRHSGTYNVLVAWPLYAWTDKDIADYITEKRLPINPLYEMGYPRVGCWACLQDMLYRDSRLFTLQVKHPQMYQTLCRKFGPEMLRLLTAWAGIENGEWKEEHLEGLYKPCLFEALDDYRKAKQKETKTLGAKTKRTRIANSNLKPHRAKRK